MGRLLPALVCGFGVLAGAVSREALAVEAKRPIIAYFIAWGPAARKYNVRSLEQSGSAARITHINYAFATIGPDLTCALTDPGADYQRAVSAGESVDGVADPVDGVALRGNFNQLRKLKALHPKLKILISVGGWLGSDRFSDAAVSQESRRMLVRSCVDRFIDGEIAPGIHAPGLFDGIDIDWEFPGACGNVCRFRPEDTANFTALLVELRAQLDRRGAERGRHYLTSTATAAGEQNFSKIELGKVAASVDFVNLMAYDLHGPSEPTTSFAAPLFASARELRPENRLWVDAAVSAYLKAGVPSEKLMLGLPFYGHGWEGVSPGPRGDGLYQPATGPAPSRFEKGSEDYRVLEAARAAKHRDKQAQALWTYDPAKRIFWTYDDATVVRSKAQYIRERKLGGAMLWELSGDDAQGTLMTALRAGLDR